MNERKTVRLRGFPGQICSSILHLKGTLRRDVGGGPWWEEKGEAETDVHASEGSEPLPHLSG